MSREDKDYAVLIGIEKYPDHTSLVGPHADVADLEAWLTDSMHGGGLDPGRVKTVLSNGAVRHPDHGEVDAAFDQVLEPAEASGGRRLYVYFSGHGLAGDSSQALLCLANWSLARRLNSALDEAQYRRALRTWGAFNEVVFFADCCRSWILGATGLPPLFAKVPPQPAVRELRAYGTRDKYPSFEAGDDIVRGHFTKALLEGLRGAAGNHQDVVPGVTASALKSYIEVRTTEIAQLHGQDQEAEVDVGIKNDAVFGRAPLIGKVVLTGPAMLAEEVVVIGPGANEVARRPAGPGAWPLNVTRGMHVVQTAAGRILGSFQPRSTVEATSVGLP